MHGKWYHLIAIGVLAIHCGLLAWGAWRHSPGYDEVGHLVAGVSHWHLGRFDLYRVNPPLVRMIAAAPVVVSRPHTDWRAWNDNPKSRCEFTLGRAFITSNGERAFWLLTLARWVVIPLSLLGAYVCWRWSSELFGRCSGTVAITLWCFSPNILAHAQMITPDAGAAALGVAAFYLFWNWLREPQWPRAMGAGLVLGLAELTKSTWILLFVLWPVLWIACRWAGRVIPAGRSKAAEMEKAPVDQASYGGRNSETRSADSGGAPFFWLHESWQMLLILALAVYVLNVGYGFEGSFRRLGEYQFVSQSLGSAAGNRFAGTWLRHVPVPLPSNYVQGIDVQKWDFEAVKPSYLRGQVRRGGWWYYYLYGLAVKVPLGTWLIIITAGVLTATYRAYRAEWRDELLLVTPLLLILVLVSAQTGINKHLRYVLPMFPFALVWASRVGRSFELGQRRLAAFIGLCLFGTIGSSLWAYPHSLSYFNELAGGPQNGHFHLLSSNISWGQDLLYLKRWLEEHPEACPLSMAVHAGFDPRDAGIEFSLPPRGPIAIDAADVHAPALFTPTPGWYAIDVNLLRGYPYSIPDGDGGLASAHQPYFTYFQGYQPVDRAGYSIYIYHILPGKN